MTKERERAIENRKHAYLHLASLRTEKITSFTPNKFGVNEHNYGCLCKPALLKFFFHFM